MEPIALQHGLGDFDDVVVRICRVDRSLHDARHFLDLGIEYPGTLGTAVDQRRAEFLAGRRCAQSALDTLGCERQPVHVGLDGAPVWPDGYHGSISHCAKWACAAVARGSGPGLGVDCESIMGVETWEDVVGVVADPAELASSLGTFDCPLVALTVIFSAKESAYKALSPEYRPGCEFLSFRVTFTDRTAGFLAVTDLRRKGPEACFPGLHLRLDESHVLTLVSSPKHIADFTIR